MQCKGMQAYEGTLITTAHRQSLLYPHLHRQRLHTLPMCTENVGSLTSLLQLVCAIC